MPNRPTCVFSITLWSLGFLFFTFSFVQMQRYHPNVCDAEGAPQFKNVRFVNWSSQEAQVYCSVNYIYVGKRPAATCEEKTWRVHGSCWQYLWMSPDKGTVFFFPTPLKPGAKFSFCATITPYKETGFTVTLSDAANGTSIVLRVVFSAFVNGVRRTRHVNIYTEQDGQALDTAQVSSSFPFAVGHKMELKLLAESHTTIGIFVDLKKLLSYNATVELRKMAFVRISGEIEVHLVNALCRTCNVDDAPLFPNAHITWLEGRWPLEGIVNCDKGDVSWKGSTPPTAKCISETWSLNGECLPRLLRKVRQTLEEGYRLPEVVTPGYVICFLAVPGEEKWPTLSFTNGSDILLSFEIRPDEKKIIASSFILNTWGPPREFPLTLELKENTVVFVKVKAITETELQVIINGIHTYDYSSGNPLRDMKYFKTTLIVLDIDLSCKEHKISFCREDVAPSLPNGDIRWRKMDDGFIGRATCSEGFVIANKDNTESYCNVASGWVVSESCTPELPDQNLRGGYRLPEVVTPGYAVCFSAKPGEEKWPTLSFTKRKDILSSFEIRPDEKTVSANSFVRETWGPPQEFPLMFELKENTVFFVKVKATTMTGLQVVINGIHTLDYSSGYFVRDIRHFKTNLNVLDIDLSCKDHKVNFCREDLAPSLPNGDMRWRKTVDGFIGSATCIEGFVVVNKYNTQSHCDLTSGWIVSQACIPELPDQKPKYNYLLPGIFDPNKKMCFSAKRGRETWPTLYFSNGKDIIIHFEIRPEQKVIARSLVNNTWRKPTEMFLPLVMKEDTVVFVKVTAVGDKDLQVVFNGIHSYRYSSDHRLQEFKYFNTSLSILENKFDCIQHLDNTCSKEQAPPPVIGNLTWWRTDGSTEGSATCDLGFVFSYLTCTRNLCDVSKGWEMTEECRLVPLYHI